MSNAKAPTWFLVTSVLGLVWNLIGCSMFGLHMSLTPEAIAELDAASQAFFEHLPSWYWVAYGVAVFAGATGCVALLLKKRTAVLLFSISLIGIFVQNYYSFFMSDAITAMGGAAYIMPTLVLIIAVSLLYLARSGVQKGWLT